MCCYKKSLHSDRKDRMLESIKKKKKTFGSPPWKKDLNNYPPPCLYQNKTPCLGLVRSWSAFYPSWHSLYSPRHFCGWGEAGCPVTLTTCLNHGFYISTKNDERWSPSTYWAPSWSTNQPPTNHHRWIFRWRDIPPGACISSALANMSVASDRVCNNLELRSSTSWRFSWVVSGFQGRVVKDVKDGVGVDVLWK